MKKVVALFSVLGASASQAAIDTASATSGIADAQTAVTAIAAVMVTFFAVRWGFKAVMGMFR